MFNSFDWTNLIEKTYGFKGNFIQIGNEKIYYNTIKILDEQLICAPCFGDFIEIKTEFEEEPFLSNFKSKGKYKFFTKSKDINLSQARSNGYIHEIISESYDDWFKNVINCKFRSQIRQANDFELKVRVSKDYQSVEEFYKLHSSLRMNKFNELPQPKSFFKNIYETYFRKNKGFIISSYYKNIITASFLCLIDQEVLYYKYSASDLNYLELRSNNKLIDSMIRFAHEINCKKINLGYTGEGSIYDGLRHFKKYTGATEYPRYLLNQIPKDHPSQTEKTAINAKLKNISFEKTNQIELDNLSNSLYKFFF